MSDIQFFQTAMGRTFFDHTMPTLVKELRRLNENIEKLNTHNEAKEKTDGDPRGSGSGGVGDGGR